MGKPGQSRQAKFVEKGEVKKKFFFLVKMHPKVQKYIQKCLKIAPNVIKINSIPI
jgi:hypothetical protein